MWIKWLEDSRAGFNRQQANKYIRIYNELGEHCSPNILDNISVRKLYSLASAPEEIGHSMSVLDTLSLISQLVVGISNSPRWESLT